jgi:phenylacetate-CoA ligase
MGMATAFISGVVFPLQERAKRHSTVAARRELERTQWLPRPALESLRLQRLRRLLTEAGTHVPYYQQVFAASGFRPETVTALSDLAKLPFLTKPLIREHTEALKSRVAGPLARSNTGGSSGEPLVFYLGKERVSHDVAAKWRATRWWDVDIGDPEIVVWGSPIELGAQDRIRALRDAVFRTELLPAFEMSPAKLDDFLARIRRRRPRMVFGYPSSIGRIVAHARERGVRLDDLGVKVVFVTAERLYDGQRAAISQAFGASVANGYGGRDAGFLAHQCPSGGMHITAEDVIIEIVSSDGRVLPVGETGEIVVTHLASSEFPFIRYRTGDVGALSDETCACGRTLPLLGKIEGRSTDFIVAADGTVMHGLALIYVVRDLPGIAAFKIVQESLDHTRVLVVPGAGYEAANVQAIEHGIGRRLGAGVRVEVSEVAEIPSEKSGKFRYVVSRVAA